MKEKSAPVRFGVSMPADLLEEFDKLLTRDGSVNRSNALSRIVREHIAAERWRKGEGIVCGSITLLYNHHAGDVLNELTEIQHSFGEVILCSTHVHISHDICLECLAVKGTSEVLKRFEKTISSLRGIISVGLAIMSVE